MLAIAWCPLKPRSCIKCYSDCIHDSAHFPATKLSCLTDWTVLLNQRVFKRIGRDYCDHTQGVAFNMDVFLKSSGEGPPETKKKKKGICISEDSLNIIGQVNALLVLALKKKKKTFKKWFRSSIMSSPAPIINNLVIPLHCFVPIWLVDSFSITAQPVQWFHRNSHHRFLKLDILLRSFSYSDFVKQKLTKGMKWERGNECL